MATGWRLFPPSMDSLEFGGGQLAGGDGLFAGTVPIQMTRGPTTKHAVVAGFHARTGGGCTRREAQLEQFANRGGSRWHSIPKSEVATTSSSSGESMICNRSPRRSFMAASQKRVFSDLDAKLANYSIRSVNAGSIEY